MLWGSGFFHLGGVGVGVVDDFAVPEPDNPGSIVLGQFRIMGDHDHQTVFGHFLEQLHDLHTGLAVQRAGGLIRQDDVRVVDQGPGDGYPLHLTAGKLVGLFVCLVAQSHLFQSLFGALFPLGFGDAGNGQGQLHIGQNGLVGNQIVALEHKANGVVPVGIPIPVLIPLGGDAVDNDVAGFIAVQAADNIQQGGLAGAAGPQHRYKLVIPQVQGDFIQGGLDEIPCAVGFADFLNLKHSFPPLSGFPAILSL